MNIEEAIKELSIEYSNDSDSLKEAKEIAVDALWHQFLNQFVIPREVVQIIIQLVQEGYTDAADVSQLVAAKLTARGIPTLASVTWKESFQRKLMNANEDETLKYLRNISSGEWWAPKEEVRETFKPYVEQGSERI